jgi:hypothetical protein
MTIAHPDRTKLRFWLLVLAMVVLWVGRASAEPVPEAETLLARPIWAQQQELVSRQEFALLVDKILQSRSLHRQAPVAVGQTTWISRAQAVNDLVRAFGFDAKLSQVDVSRIRFIDVPESHPYRNAVLLAGQTNLILGYPDHSFRPDEALRWKEAAALLITLRGWTMAMPETAPSWVTAKQEKASAWYRLFDTVRLALTIAYGAVAIYYLTRAYRQPIKNRTRRLVTNSLLMLSVVLVLAWINDLGFTQGWFHRTLYEIGAFLSLVAGFMLLRTGQTLALPTPATEPMPKRTNINLAVVESIDHTKGEMYVVDPLSKRRIMVIVTPETKVYTRQKQDSAIAFFSEIQTGDVVNLQGSSHQRGALISALSLLVVSSGKVQTAATEAYQLRPLYLETQSAAPKTVKAIHAYR